MPQDILMQDFFCLFIDHINFIQYCLVLPKEDGGSADQDEIAALSCSTSLGLTKLVLANEFF